MKVLYRGQVYVEAKAHKIDAMVGILDKALDALFPKPDLSRGRYEKEVETSWGQAREKAKREFLHGLGARELLYSDPSRVTYEQVQKALAKAPPRQRDFLEGQAKQHADGIAKPTYDQWKYEMDAQQYLVRPTDDDSLCEVIVPKEHAKNVRGLVKQHGWEVIVDNDQHGTSRRFLLGNGEVKPKKKMPKFVYHLTLRKNEKAIRSGGLRPKPSRWTRKYGSDRIYVFLPGSKVFGLGDMAEQFEIANKLKAEDLIVLKIDTSKIPSVKWFVDPEMPDVAAYTEQAIPSRAFTIYKTVSDV